MELSNQVIKWIESDSYRMEALVVASTLGLRDWCLAAGFVRNLIWDKLHSKDTFTPLNDIDLIYFDANTTEEKPDIEYEEKLKSLSNHPWSVKNQARVHIRNNDQPYLSTSDAMSYWVEVETAVGATYSEENGVSIVAPFGLEANFSNSISLNPKRPKPSGFLKRVADKEWPILWPNLEVIY